MTKQGFISEVLGKKIYVGKEVKIRKDLKSGVYYGDMDVVENMIKELKEMNYKLVIKKIHGDNNDCFRVKNSIYSYSVEMMEDDD